MRKFYLFLSVLLSFFHPVRVRKGSSNENPVLELFLYRNRWQLATSDALYSDGHKYRPLVMAYKELAAKLPDARNVLVLGAGLGSAISVMDKLGFHPAFTLVDNDTLVLQWALEKLGEHGEHSITPVCDDAQAYMQKNTQQYDLVIIDIFSGRVVPDFVVKPAFLEYCKSAVLPPGNVVLNYIVNHPKEWDELEATFNSVFPVNKVLKNDDNRILVATV